MDAAQFKQLADLVHTSWYASLDFWLAIVGIIVSGVGAFLSYRAFVEAGKAERAAKEAAGAVKRQSDIASLAEVIQKLARLQPKCRFAKARGLFITISGRLKRIIAPQRKDAGLANIFRALDDALATAAEALQSAKPESAASERKTPNAVYNAMEGPFSTIHDLANELYGLMESKAMHLGEED